jgi:hypothetical protein
VVEDLFRVMEETKAIGKISMDIDSTFIYLISKKDIPKYFDECIPISLRNCLYKLIIAKIIAMRIN